MKVLSSFIDEEKILKFALIIFLIPFFMVSCTLSILFPPMLLDETKDKDLQQIKKEYMTVDSKIKEGTQKYIDNMGKSYDSIEINDNTYINGDLLMIIDSARYQQDFKKASAKSILELGNMFISRSYEIKTEKKIVEGDKYYNSLTGLWEQEEDYTVTVKTLIVNITERTTSDVCLELGLSEDEIQLINFSVDNFFEGTDDITNRTEFYANMFIDPLLYKTEDPVVWLTGDCDFDMIVQGRLSALAKDKNRKINIVSGLRTVEEQQYLWDKRKRENPRESDSETARWVARPGRSRHQYGIAADVSGWVKALTNIDLRKYGLHKPMNYESWHIEPTETKK